MVCLDTDIIVHFLRNNKEAVYLISKIVAEKSKIITTSINEFELWKGIYKYKGKGREKPLQQFLSNVKVINFDSVASKKAAQIFEELESRGEVVDALDVMIASIAIVHNEKLLTLNKKHFERIEGLNITKL